MEHLDITITSPEGSPWLHITVRGKGHVFSHTEKFSPQAALGVAVRHACDRFTVELASWTKFVEALNG